MARLTYFVALSFLRTEDGDIVAGEPFEARTGDPKLGEFDEAEIIKVFGEVDTAVVG